jgi:hypothetical protein
MSQTIRISAEEMIPASATKSQQQLTDGAGNRGAETNPFPVAREFPELRPKIP